MSGSMAGKRVPDPQQRDLSLNSVEERTVRHFVADVVLADKILVGPRIRVSMRAAPIR